MKALRNFKLIHDNFKPSQVFRDLINDTVHDDYVTPAMFKAIDSGMRFLNDRSYTQACIEATIEAETNIGQLKLEERYVFFRVNEHPDASKRDAFDKVFQFILTFQKGVDLSTEATAKTREEVLDSFDRRMTHNQAFPDTMDKNIFHCLRPYFHELANAAECFVMEVAGHQIDYGIVINKAEKEVAWLSIKNSPTFSKLAVDPSE